MMNWKNITIQHWQLKWLNVDPRKKFTEEHIEKSWRVSFPDRDSCYDWPKRSSHFDITDNSWAIWIACATSERLALRKKGKHAQAFWEWAAYLYKPWAQFPDVHNQVLINHRGVFAGKPLSGDIEQREKNKFIEVRLLRCFAFGMTETPEADWRTIDVGEMVALDNEEHNFVSHCFSVGIEPAKEMWPYGVRRKKQKPINLMAQIGGLNEAIGKA